MRRALVSEDGYMPAQAGASFACVTVQVKRGDHFGTVRGSVRRQRGAREHRKEPGRREACMSGLVGKTLGERQARRDQYTDEISPMIALN